MHGNVYEWCSDWWDETLAGGADPVGPIGGSRIVYRGGSWKFPLVHCRSASRFHAVPSDRDDSQGFRVARSQSVK